MRLFLEWSLSAGNQTLPDDQTGIAIRIAAHGACFTEHERRSRGIACYRLSLGVADHQTLATSAFSGRIPGIDPAGDDPLVPRFVFGVGEDASLHPESAFAIAPVAIFALLWLEGAQVLKDQDGGPLLFGKQDNASADQVREVLICLSDLAPESRIVLFALRNNASLGAVPCNAS
jgi:hypothetical protein